MRGLYLLLDFCDLSSDLRVSNVVLLLRVRGAIALLLDHDLRASLALLLDHNLRAFITLLLDLDLTGSAIASTVSFWILPACGG